MLCARIGAAHVDRRYAGDDGSGHRRRRKPGFLWRLDACRAHLAHPGPFDLAFAERYRKPSRRARATIGFNNLVLAPDYLVGLLIEMSANQAMCDEFTEGFTDPEHLWFDIVKDAETAAFASSHR